MSGKDKLHRDLTTVILLDYLNLLGNTDLTKEVILWTKIGRQVARRIKQTTLYQHIDWESIHIDRARHDVSCVAHSVLTQPTMHPYRILTLLVFTADLCQRWHLRDTNQPLMNDIIQHVLVIVWQHYFDWQPWLEQVQESTRPSAVTMVLMVIAVGLRCWDHAIHQ